MQAHLLGDGRRVRIGLAREADVDPILELNRANQEAALAPHVRSRSGFLSWLLEPADVERSINDGLAIVALGDGPIAGYCVNLAVRDALATGWGGMVPRQLMAQATQLRVEGRPLADHRISVGSVCIADGYRGRGLSQPLFDARRAAVSGFDLALAPISVTNTRSLAVFQKHGYELIATLDPGQGEHLHMLVLRLP